MNKEKDNLPAAGSTRSPFEDDGLPIGAILKMRRRGLGLKQKEVAEYCGMSIPAYARVESPRSNPTMHTLGPILSFLKLNLGLCRLSCPTRTPEHCHVQRAESLPVADGYRRPCEERGF